MSDRLNKTIKWYECEDDDIEAPSVLKPR